MSQVFSSTTCNAGICGHNVVHSNRSNHPAGAAGPHECCHIQCKRSKGGDSRWEEGVLCPSVKGIPVNYTGIGSGVEECLYNVCLSFCFVG